MGRNTNLAKFLGAMALGAGVGLGAFISMSGYATASPSGASGTSRFSVGLALESLMILLWCALGTIGIWRDRPWMVIAGLIGYLGLALLFGFGIGGLFLFFSGPLAALAAGFYLAGRRRERPENGHLAAT